MGCPRTTESRRKVPRTADRNPRQRRRVASGNCINTAFYAMQDVRRIPDGWYATNGYDVRSPILFQVRLGNPR